MRLEDNACQLTRGKFKRQLIQLLRAPTLRLPKGVLSIPLAMLASGIVVFVVFNTPPPNFGSIFDNFCFIHILRFSAHPWLIKKLLTPIIP